MAPYSMDLRKRVAKAWDASWNADAVAAHYDVSRASVHRLIQRRRETGSLGRRVVEAAGVEPASESRSS